MVAGSFGMAWQGEGNAEAPDDAAARALLRQAGLRATRQRMALVDLLFGCGGRHVSVEGLHRELLGVGAPGSISCVYNSLRRFSEVGLVRRVPVYGATSYFDTKLDHHHHFYAEDEDHLMDVPMNAIALDDLPPPPLGYELVSVDVVVRVRRERSAKPVRPSFRSGEGAS